MRVYAFFKKVQIILLMVLHTALLLGVCAVLVKSVVVHFSSNGTEFIIPERITAFLIFTIVLITYVILEKKFDYNMYDMYDHPAWYLISCSIIVSLFSLLLGKCNVFFNIVLLILCFISIIFFIVGIVGVWPDRIRDTKCSYVKKCKKLNVLKKIAQSDKDWYVRAAAVENSNLTDMAVLSEAALKDKDWCVRAIAVENSNLTDMAVLSEAALKDKDWYVRAAAVENSNLTDMAVLSEAALKDEDWYVRAAAVKNSNLTDMAVLSEAALKDEVWYVRIVAVERITDQNVLALVALNDANEKVRRAAVERITDKNALVRVALNDDADEEVRKAAVERITDKNVLAKIAQNDKSSIVRNVAACEAFGHKWEIVDSRSYEQEVYYTGYQDYYEGVFETFFITTYRCTCCGKEKIEDTFDDYYGR